jgi:hypothetical protein
VFEFVSRTQWTTNKTISRVACVLSNRPHFALLWFEALLETKALGTLKHQIKMKTVTNIRLNSFDNFIRTKYMEGKKPVDESMKPSLFMYLYGLCNSVFNT